MDKTGKIAMAVLALAAVLYYMLVLPRLMPKQDDVPAPIVEDAAQPAGATVPDQAGGSGSSVPETKPGEAGASPAQPVGQAEATSGAELRVTQEGQNLSVREDLVLANDVLSTTWTSKGAGLVNAVLTEYKSSLASTKTPEDRGPMTLIRHIQDGYSSLVVEAIGDLGGLEDWVYEVVEADNRHILFRASLPGDLVVEKEVSIPDGRQYHLDISLKVTNKGAEVRRLSYRIRSAAGAQPETYPTNDLAGVIVIKSGDDKHKIEKKDPNTIARKKPDPNRSGGIVWAGTMSSYFTAVLGPSAHGSVSEVTWNVVSDSDLLNARGFWAEGGPAGSKTLAGLKGEGALNACLKVVTGAVNVEPGQTLENDFKFVIAPKRDDILREYPGGEEMIVYGYFRSISIALVWILRQCHRVLPNYGVCIIILTLIVKACLHPLTRKSQMSMVMMQKVQPEIAKLKEKYGDDRARIAQEQMALFKKYGINPMSGCLPVFLQLPVFLALFGALRAAIELRQAPFWLWIRDLSMPDTLLYLPFDIPLMGTRELNTLPFIMAAVSLFSARMQPKSPDPQQRQQQVMMMYMPVIFAFLLYRFPSGLMLYWTLSTVVGMGEQWFIKRATEKVKAEPLTAKKMSPRKAKLMKAIQQRQQRWEKKYGK
ncbi:MAG TPA: membrane protein insertase YidC [Candidatus Brocadiia bacterium]|nr:membrane protein insertase YidC [Candidatus Brocadiia bacterium]